MIAAPFSDEFLPPYFKEIIHNNKRRAPWNDYHARQIYIREFGIRDTLKKLNRQLEKVADSFGNIADI